MPYPRTLWSLCLVLLAACSGTTGTQFAPTDGGPVDGGGGTGTDAYVWDTARPDVYHSTLPVVVGVEPAHGPFNGGNTVIIRGSNFTDQTSATFGGALVQPSDTTLTDSHRLTVKPPAGRPGDVDVAVQDTGRTATLPMGYHYDSIYADPNNGSTAGGDQITIHGMGTHFTDASVVTLDGVPCHVVQVTGPESLDCTTAAHALGLVDLRVVTGDENILVAQGYQYSDDAGTITGALGGGVIHGTVNVQVLSGNTGDVIPGAYVFLGTDPTVPPPQSGLTDGRGQHTFSIPDLAGPLTLTASAHCFSSHTMQAFDARNVVIYLYPMMIPACGMGSGGGGGSSGGTYGTQISGELVWDGSMEFAPNEWRNVPYPRAGERRVAFVYTTQQSILYTNPPPGDGGTVLETVTPGYGGRGYPFTILARPAAVAVYAIAGIENIQTQRFTPFIMGVARGVLGSPRAQITNVIVPMNITLTHETDVTIHDLPVPANGQPDTLKVEGYIDLGGEGVIARPDITVTGHTASDPYRLVALPAFTGPLADARLTVRGTFGSTVNLNTPFSVMIAAGARTPDEPVDLAHWVGIPVVTTPSDNGPLPADRTVRFNLNGADPDMFWMTLSGSVFYWQSFAPGGARSFGFPDISSVMGLSDLPRGQSFYMNITGLRVPSLNFNTFRYSYLSQLYWSAYAEQTLLFTR